MLTVTGWITKGAVGKRHYKFKATSERHRHRACLPSFCPNERLFFAAETKVGPEPWRWRGLVSALPTFSLSFDWSRLRAGVWLVPFLLSAAEEEGLNLFPSCVQQGATPCHCCHHTYMDARAQAPDQPGQFSGTGCVPTGVTCCNEQ